MSSFRKYKRRISPAQLRAARAYLDWGRKHLQRASGVSVITIRNIERGMNRAIKSTEDRIIAAFRKEGVEFTRHDGIRRIPPKGRERCRRRRRVTWPTVDFGE